MSSPCAISAALPAPIIELQGVEKSYGRQPVLRGLSLRVEAGEFVAINGRSGSGKTTLLNVAGGLCRPDRGDARVAGFDLAALPDRALSRFRNQRVAFVFQCFNLLEPLTCLENVRLPSFFAAASADDRDSRGRAGAALTRVGLGSLAGTKAGALSGGQRQRVAIARALFTRPSIVFADEPTGNLDADTGEEVIALFSRIVAEDGLTLVVVTHEERVSRAASRTIRLEDGRIVP